MIFKDIVFLVNLGNICKLHYTVFLLGVISNQCGSIWTDLPMIQETMANARQHFKTVLYSWSSVPTYPNGQIGYLIAGLDNNNDLKMPKFKFSEEETDKLDLKYYSTDVHTASFVVPNFVKKVIY